MRRLSYMLLVCAVLAGCAKEEAATWNGLFIELSVCSDESYLETKAGMDGTKDGVTRLNENLLGDIDFFFYPGADPTGDAVMHRKVTSGKKEGHDVFRLEITSDDVNLRLFPSESKTTQCTVFAIVNYPGTLVEDEEDLGGTSLEDLEMIVVNTDFLQEDTKEYKQPSFMMSGRTVLNLRGRTQIMTATGDIYLERYASKMTIGISVTEKKELPNHEVWYPMLEGMEIYLVNAAGSVRLSGEDTNPHFFSYAENPRKFAKLVNDEIVPIVGKTGDYYDSYPMYMYPQHWTYGATYGTDREPYLKLVLPWARSAENGHSTTQKQFYYKIVIPDDTRGDDFKRRFIRNNWYHLNIDISILGAETDEASIPVTPGTCFMVYWQDKNVVIKQAEIGSARYLSVDQNFYEIHNEDSHDIHYTTSHPVILKNIRVTRPYYGESTSGDALGGTIHCATAEDPYPVGSYYLEYDEEQRKKLSDDGKDWFDNTGTYLVYKHRLINDYMKKMFDYSPYRVTFTLVHEDRPDDTRYSKDITIIQYPAIYIEGLMNSDDTFVFQRHGNWKKDIYTSDHWGYVYVDNEQIVRPDDHNKAIDNTYINGWKAQGYNYPNAEEYHWRIVWYTGGSRDIFKMNVTVLPPRSEFVIGDPRTDEIDNLDKSFHTAPSLYGANPRTLQWYYPTENSERTYNMMAPSYRIASKCGGVEFDGITYEQALWRCASFQEDGFPAGRWRLPSRGEISFIAQLSANKAFTFLFGEGGVYWSANGAIKVLVGGIQDVSDTRALARCVYDSWYWGDTQQDDRSQFVWGDMPR